MAEVMLLPPSAAPEGKEEAPIQFPLMRRESGPVGCSTYCLAEQEISTKLERKKSRWTLADKNLQT